jgi:hypothetical protein
MVELSIGWLEDIKQRDGVEKWLELVETLRAVTEGKVDLPIFLLYSAAPNAYMHRSSWKHRGLE